MDSKVSPLWREKNLPGRDVEIILAERAGYEESPLMGAHEPK